MATAISHERQCLNLTIQKDVISRLRHLNMESITLLPKYIGADTDKEMEEIYNVGICCINAISYIERHNYENAIDIILRIDTSKFTAVDDYEEILTYYQDKWDLELIAIIASIRYLMKIENFDFHSIIRQVKEAREYEKRYKHNSGYIQSEPWIDQRIDELKFQQETLGYWLKEDIRI